MGSKADLYDTVLRNGYYLPSITSTLVSEQYLTSVMAKKIFCPLFEEIRKKPAPSLPTKAVLILKLVEVAIVKNWEMGISEQLQPNKTWIVDLLSSFKPDDEVFNKGYLTPPIKRKQEEHKTVVIPKDFL